MIIKLVHRITELWGIISQLTHCFSKIFGSKKSKQISKEDKVSGSGDKSGGGDAKVFREFVEPQIRPLSAEESAQIIKDSIDPDKLRAKYKAQDEVAKKLREVFPSLPFSGIIFLTSN